MHASQVVSFGRSFTRGLITKPHSVLFDYYHISLSADDKLNLPWWARLLSSWNGVTMMAYRHWSPLFDFTISSDAAGSLGFGIVYGNQWCTGSWLSEACSLNIAVLELIPIIIAAAIWGCNWARRRILFRTDNEAVVFSTKSQLPKHPHLAFLIRELALLALLHNFEFQVIHVRGLDNSQADALSRNQIHCFRSLHPLADPNPTAIPDQLLINLCSPGL